MRAVPEQPGMYRGDFTALAPGLHQFSVKPDPAAVLEFAVAEAKFESGETAMNESLLKQMAERSVGAFFREETLHLLPEALRPSRLYYLLLLAVATVEWALPKRAQLK